MNVQVALTSATRTVHLSAFYRRTQGGDVQHLSGSTHSVSPGSAQLPFPVNIAGCLADKRASNGRTCPLRVAITLRDDALRVLDSTEIGPFEVGGGSTLGAVAVALAVPSNIELIVPDSLRVGDTASLSAVLRDSSNVVLVGRPVVWTSLDTAIVSITAQGLLTAKAAGVVQLRATTPTATASVSRRVLVDVASVTLGLPERIRFGDTPFAAVTANDRRGQPVSPQRVEWSSSDTSVAVVDSATGQLVTFAAGNVTIRANADGRLSSISRTIVPDSLGDLEGKYFHMCGLGKSGRAYCWGGGASGYDTTVRLRPLAVPSDSTFTELSSGSDHLCGLTRSGRLMCVGRSNTEGQLAVGDFAPRHRMTLSVGGPGVYRALAAGGRQTCVLDELDRAWCAGHGSRLGLGTDSLQKRATLTQVPVPPLRMLVGGETSTCGITSGGAVWCWGSEVANAFPTFLGNDSIFPSSQPGAPKAASLGMRVAVSVAHTSATACVLDATAEVWCWQNDQFASVPLPPGLQITEIRGTNNDFCAVAADANAWCWAAVTLFVRPARSFPPGVAPARVAGGLMKCIETPGGQPWCWNWFAPGDGVRYPGNAGVGPVRVLLPGER